jgi:hypothetical protein
MTPMQELFDRARAAPLQGVIDHFGFRLKRAGVHERVGPCPNCGGRDRFSINTAKRVFNCRGCGAKGKGAIDLVMRIGGLDFRAAIELLAGETLARPLARPSFSSPAAEPGDDDEDEKRKQQQQHRKASWLWSCRQPIVGSIAERYLREARGITCPLPPTLAYLPPTKPEHHPALIAAFALPVESEPDVLAAPRSVSAVHLTLLLPDGSDKLPVEKPKSNKLVIASPGPLPIALAPVNDLLGLVMAEGIENALSLHQVTGLGAWAAGAAGRLPGLADAVPAWIEAATIAVDDDPAGRRHSAELAARLEARDIEVRAAT